MQYPSITDVVSCIVMTKSNSKFQIQTINSFCSGKES